MVFVDPKNLNYRPFWENWLKSRGSKFEVDLLEGYYKKYVEICIDLVGGLCVCMCVRVCVCAFVRLCVRVRVSVSGCVRACVRVCVNTVMPKLLKFLGCVNWLCI